MAGIPQKCDFLTYNIQSFVRIVKLSGNIILLDQVDIGKFLDFILPCVITNCLVLLRNFVKRLVE